MTDVSFTGTDVKKSSGQVGLAVSAETIAAGDPVYIDDSDNLMYVADASTADSPAATDTLGVALGGGATGQTVPYAKGQGTKVDFGTGVFTAGVFYFVSPSEGIMPAGDLASTNYSIQLGYAETTDILVLQPVIAGVALA